MDQSISIPCNTSSQFLSISEPSERVQPVRGVFDVSNHEEIFRIAYVQDFVENVPSPTENEGKRNKSSLSSSKDDEDDEIDDSENASSQQKPSRKLKRMKEGEEEDQRENQFLQQQSQGEIADNFNLDHITGFSPARGAQTEILRQKSGSIGESFLNLFKKSTIKRKNTGEKDRDEGFSSQLWQHRAMKIIQKVIYFSTQMLQLSAVYRFRILKRKQLLILNDVTAVDMNKDLIDKTRKSKPNLIFSIKDHDLPGKIQTDAMRDQMMEYFQSQLKPPASKQVMTYLTHLAKKIPIISPDSSLKIAWDMFFIFFIIFRVMTIPMILSYDLVWFFGANDNENALGTADMMTVGLMSMNMILCSNTAIFKQGTLIQKRAEIIYNYQKQFFLDLVVLICYSAGIIVQNEFLKFSIVVKLYQVTRIVMFMEEIFHPRQIVYSVIDIIKIVFIIMFIAHMISCFIYYISKDNHSETTWISKLNYHNWYEYYITGLYFAIITMITIGYGDVVPVSLTEKIFVMSMTFISCGVFAYSLNTISRIISEVSQRRSKLRKKMIQLNIHIESKGLSKGVAVKVRKYLEYFYQENEQDQATSEKDLQVIPQSLKDEVYLDIHGRLLKQSKMFSLNFSVGFLNTLALLLKERKYGPEEVIYHPNEKGTTLYFIIKGSVELYLPVKNPSDSDYPVVSSLKKGESFGIYSFFSGKFRETGAISKQVTSVVMLELNDFISAVANFEEDYEVYCMMKDKVNLSNSTFGLDVKCKSCGRFNHQLYDCPLISYRPKKQLVIARSNRSLPQTRETVDRKGIRTPNSLFLLSYLIEFSKQKQQQQDELSLTSLDEINQQLHQQTSQSNGVMYKLERKQALGPQKGAIMDNIPEETVVNTIENKAGDDDNPSTGQQMQQIQLQLQPSWRDRQQSGYASSLQPSYSVKNNNNNNHNNINNNNTNTNNFTSNQAVCSSSLWIPKLSSSNQVPLSGLIPPNQQQQHQQNQQNSPWRNSNLNSINTVDNSSYRYIQSLQQQQQFGSARRISPQEDIPASADVGSSYSGIQKPPLNSGTKPRKNQYPVIHSQSTFMNPSNERIQQMQSLSRAYYNNAHVHSLNHSNSANNDYGHQSSLFKQEAQKENNNNHNNQEDNHNNNVVNNPPENNQQQYMNFNAALNHFNSIYNNNNNNNNNQNNVNNSPSQFGMINVAQRSYTINLNNTNNPNNQSIVAMNTMTQNPHLGSQTSIQHLSSLKQSYSQLTPQNNNNNNNVTEEQNYQLQLLNQQQQPSPNNHQQLQQSNPLNFNLNDGDLSTQVNNQLPGDPSDFTDQQQPTSYYNSSNKNFPKDILNSQLQYPGVIFWFSAIMHFDRMFAFKRYLPHNNYEKVLERIKRLNLKRRRTMLATQMTNQSQKNNHTHNDKPRLSKSQQLIQQSINRESKMKLSQVIKQAEIGRKRRLTLLIQTERCSTKQITKNDQFSDFGQDQNNRLVDIQRDSFLNKDLDFIVLDKSKKKTEINQDQDKRNLEDDGDERTEGGQGREEKEEGDNEGQEIFKGQKQKNNEEFNQEQSTSKENNDDAQENQEEDDDNNSRNKGKTSLSLSNSCKNSQSNVKSSRSSNNYYNQQNNSRQNHHYQLHTANLQQQLSEQSSAHQLHQIEREQNNPKS